MPRSTQDNRVIQPTRVPVTNARSTSVTDTSSNGGSCEARRWLQDTRNNTIERRLIVLDSWAGTGLGHSFTGTANWLALVQQLAVPRSLRFAFCIPPDVNSSFQPAASVRDVNGRLWRMPICSERTFDLHEHITFDGVSLRTTAVDFELRHLLEHTSR